MPIVRFLSRVADPGGIDPYPGLTYKKNPDPGKKLDQDENATLKNKPDPNPT